jgi:hypothetical protein
VRARERHDGAHQLERSSGATSYSLQRALKSAPTVYTDLGDAITGTTTTTRP